MRFAIWGALAGVIPPIVIMAMTYFQGGVFKWPTLAVALWPTSIMLMGTMGQELTANGFVIFVLSVLLNQILYAVLGVLVGLLSHRLIQGA